MKKQTKQNLFILGLILILIILLLRNCNLSETTTRDVNFKIDQSYLSIPPEATFIGVFNTNQVLEGIGFEALKKTPSYINNLQSYYSQNPPFARVFSDPSGVGIDVNEKSVFYISVGTAADEVYSNTIFTLANLSAFEDAIAKSGRGKYKSKGNIKYLTIDEVSAVGWNDKFVSFISTDPSYDKMEIFDRIFTDTKTKYFDNNKKFQDYIFENESDFAYWVDCTSYSKNQLHATGKPGEISGLLLRDNYIYGDANFNQGEIDANVKFDFNTFLNAAQNKLFKDGYDTKILELIPNINPSILLNTSLNLEGIFSLILDDIDLKLEARNSLASYGLTLDDLTQAIEGDMLITGFPSKQGNKSSTIFAVKIKDHDHFQTLLQVWQDLQIIEVEGSNLFKINQGTPPLFPIAATYPDRLQRLIIRGDYAYVSLDNNVIEHIEANQKSEIIKQNILLDENENKILFSGYLDNRIKEVKDVIQPYAIKEMKLNYEDQSLVMKFKFTDDKLNPLKYLFPNNKK